MNKRVSYVAIRIFGAAIFVTLTACSALPPATPEAIGLAGKRIELNAVAAHTALTNLIDNAEISHKQIKAAYEELEEIEGNLSEEDRRRVQEALRLLDEAGKGLQPSEAVISVRDQIRPRLEGTSSALKQIQGILSEKTEQEDIVNNLVERLRSEISSEKKED